VSLSWLPVYLMLENHRVIVEGELFRYTAEMRIKLLMTFGITLLLAGCGASVPVKTTLAALSEAQKDFDGRQVIVSGTLRTFDTPRHYWIENEALDRVALLEGTINLAPLVSQTVTVRGMFRYDSEAGRRIEVDEFVALD
jgi:hypothetical protein